MAFGKKIRQEQTQAKAPTAKPAVQAQEVLPLHRRWR
jgi:hypothetical protein